jgi:hypothetical protein
MRNGPNFDTRVNPRQRAQGNGHDGAWANSGDVAADLASSLESAAAQARALARSRGSVNLRIYIDTVIVVTDPRALEPFLGGGRPWPISEAGEDVP